MNRVDINIHNQLKKIVKNVKSCSLEVCIVNLG